jgi:23S rRNA A1618 N6-methylase RlmF
MSSIIEPDKRCAKTTQQPENHPLKFQAVGKKRKRERGDKTTKTQNPGATATATLASFSTLSQIKSNIHPNFEELSASYPNFAQKWEKLRQRQKKSKQGRGGGSSLNAHVDFDLNAALSRAILDKYFNLNLKCMPRGYLCPPIPNRFNYVLWIKELLNDSSPSHDESKSKSESESSKYFQESQRLHVVRHGIDLGIGVSCIYPLLLSSHEFTNDQSWRFLGTDIDPYSIKCAQENIDANGLQEVIKLALVSPAPIDRGCGLKTVSITDETNGGNSPDQNDITTPLNTAMKAASHTYQENEVMFDFCMSNPPFYSNSDEATVPRSGDGRNRTDMTFHESVYPGGELGFALDMLHDSFSYRERITWYTLMVSKKSSLIAFEKELAKVGFHRGSVRTTEFVQGNMMRWGVAWTFLTPSVRSPGKEWIVLILVLPFWSTCHSQLFVLVVVSYEIGWRC